MGKAKYTEYKASKTLWQEQIPSHWKETELRMLFADNKNKNLGLVERNLLSLSYGKLKRKDIDNATGLVPASFEGYQIIDKGYIVLRFTDLQNDKKSLRVGYANERGIITNAYIGLAPKEDFYSKYYYYQLHFLDKIKYFYNLGGGVRQSLAFKEFGRETVLIPDIDEQIKIVNFLDYKLAKIEHFILKKKQLIKLLNEQKAAIINQAVTKGIDHNAKMKDSGIEWVGKIPEHWEVKKLKYVCYLQRGHDLSKEQFIEGVIPVYGSNGIIGYHNKSSTKAPCITVGRSGSVGKVNFVKTDFWAHNTCLFVNKSFGNNWQYLFYLLKSIDISMASNGSAVPTLDRKNVHELLIAYPKLSEQISIASHIECEILKLNKVINTIEREITLTEEYKTSIIAEAVTGKIDVRSYEIPEIASEEVDYEELEEEIGIVAENQET